MYKKKTKLNPVIEKEETVKTIETDIVVRDDAPPTVSEETHHLHYQQQFHYPQQSQLLQQF